LIMVTNAPCSDIHWNELWPAIHKEWRIRVSQGVLLLLDNAHPRAAAHTMTTTELGSY